MIVECFNRTIIKKIKNKQQMITLCVNTLIMYNKDHAFITETIQLPTSL